jgi:hypothetical protein
MTISKLVLFIITAIPGLALLLFGSLDLIANYFDQRAAHGNPLVSCFIAIIGMLLMLLGVGEWGKWRYLVVFLAIPLSLLAVVSLSPSWLGGKVLPAIFIGGMTFLVLYVVRATYRNIDK